MRVLVSLTDGELRKVEQALPLIRRVVRSVEDEQTSAGLSDLASDSLITSTLSELDRDLERLLRTDRGSAR